MNQLLKIITIVFFTLLFVGCNKFLDAARPDDNINIAEAFGSDESANAVAANLYADMSATIDYPNGFLTRYMGQYADELQRFTPISLSPDEAYYNSDVLASDKILLSFWSKPYAYIFHCNNIIEHVKDNSNLSDTMRSKLMGEAKFLRALHYFYLVNIFGDVPEITETDYRTTLTKPRQKKELIWQMIINDLVEAERLLPLPSPNGDMALLTGIRASKWAAKALLARAYLYIRDWPQAIKYASELIESGRYQLETDLNQVFRINSREVIFQIQPSKPGSNTADALFFVPLTSSAPLLILRPELYNSFETGDLRKLNWVHIHSSGTKENHYPYKYKVRTSSPAEEYNVALRLAEMYLIRAEAFAHQGQLYGTQSAATDLDTLRARAGLSVLPASILQQGMLQHIEQERRTELFAEWGHRWFDLKRTAGFNTPGQTRAEEVLKVLKPGFSQYKLLLPVPQDERTRNTNLEQNPGY